MISVVITKHFFARFTVIFVLALAFVFFARAAEAATLSLSPNTGVYTAGGTFTARVVINTEGKSINAAEATIKFNTANLSVVSVSKGSIFNLWTNEPTFSNSAGTIVFGGGSPAGYKGSAGTILNVTFRAKSAGTSKVNFQSGSILAADGLGTNILTAMNGATYTLAAAEVVPEPEVIEYIAPANTPAAPQIVSKTHPDQTGWYKANEANLSWTLPSGVVSLRTLLDENSGTVPTKVYDSPISEIALSELDEGVQYFHLQYKNENGWGRVAHYRLAVDNSAPESFTIDTLENFDLSNPEQTFLLNFKDAVSGIDYYSVQVDNEDPYKYVDETGSSTITLPPLAPGPHSLIIEAFDKAGNSIIATKSFTVASFDKPRFTEYPSQIPAEVIPVIKGITKPEAKVRLSVKKTGSEPNFYDLVADQEGIFIFVPEARFSEGVYEINAFATDNFGAQSEVSDTLKLAVQQPGYLKLGNMVISVLSILVPLVALLLLLSLSILYFFARLRKIKTVVTKETKEAETILSQEFKNLQSTLDAEKLVLKQSRKSGKLTKNESDLLKKISKSLEVSQSKIAKEISDVDDIVE